MPVEQRGQVIAVEHGPTGSNREEPEVQRKAAAFARWHEPDDAIADSSGESVRGIQFGLQPMARRRKV